MLVGEQENFRMRKETFDLIYKQLKNYIALISNMWNLHWKQMTQLSLVKKGQY